MAKKEASQKEPALAQTSNKNAQMGRFMTDTKDELAKVVWPSRQQLISESAAVILMVSLVTTVIYLVDQLFSWGAGKVF